MLRGGGETYVTNVYETPLGGDSSSLSLTGDEWEDIDAIARSYVALCRQQLAAPGRYTDLDLAIQKRRRALAERVIAAAEEAVT